MSPRLEQRRRVAVLDPVLRSREHVRRAVRALGHTPLVFNSMEELLLLRGAPLRCSAMCLGSPPDTTDLRVWVRNARSMVAADVPLLFLTRDNLLKDIEALSCVEGDQILAAPTSFADVYNALEAFLAEHELPTAGRGLEWDGFRFMPSLESVMVDGTEIWLKPLEFELALEFFHNVDRVLSRDWLRGMASGVAPSASGRWLDASVGRLRSQLGLASLHGCEWKLSNVSHAGFKLSKDHGKKGARASAVPERHLLQHQPE